MNTVNQQIIDLAKARGLIRTRDISSLGLSRVALTRLVRSGQLLRLGRGLYALPNRVASEHAAFAELFSEYSDGFVCLLSALRFHHLTTQSPFAVWLGIPHKARVPKIDYPALHIVRFTGRGLSEGIEEHLLDGVTVKVSCLARTVVDCFKFRNKIGIDVALEALHESWFSKRVTMDELWHYATIFRVANILRPYMENL